MNPPKTPARHPRLEELLRLSEERQEQRLGQLEARLSAYCEELRQLHDAHDSAMQERLGLLQDPEPEQRRAAASEAGLLALVSRLTGCEAGLAELAVELHKALDLLRTAAQDRRLHGLAEGAAQQQEVQQDLLRQVRLDMQRSRQEQRGLIEALDARLEAFGEALTRGQASAPGALAVLGERLEALDAALSELRQETRRTALSEEHQLDRFLDWRLAPLEAALSELRAAVGSETRTATQVPRPDPGIEALLVEVRQALSGASSQARSAEGSGSTVEAVLELLVQMRIDLLSRREEPVRSSIAPRLDALEAALAEIRLTGPAPAPPEALAPVLLRLDGLEAALAEIRLTGPAPAPPEALAPVLLRLDGLEAALAEIRLRQDDPGSLPTAPSPGRSDAMEALLAETRQGMERLQRFVETQQTQTFNYIIELLHTLENASISQQRSLARIDAGQGMVRAASLPATEGLRTSELEGLLSEVRLALSAHGPAEEARRQRVYEQLEAVEAAVADQRHALHKLVTTFDANAYAQRLELQRRLADLVHNIADQRQEQKSQLTAIEAGISDQRYTLVKLAAMLSREGPSGEASDWAEVLEQLTPVREADLAPRPPDRSAQGIAKDPAASPEPTAFPPWFGRPLTQKRTDDEVDRKLDLVLDCLLADHLAELAGIEHQQGRLSPEAHEKLMRTLDEHKLARLRSRYPAGGPPPAPEDKPR